MWVCVILVLDLWFWLFLGPEKRGEGGGEGGRRKRRKVGQENEKKEEGE